MSDVYHDPKGFGLKILHEYEAEGGYSFDKIILWQDLTNNQLFYGHDSGCSCPLPFGGWTREHITPVSLHSLPRFTGDCLSWGCAIAPYIDFVRLIREHDKT